MEKSYGDNFYSLGWRNLTVGVHYNSGGWRIFTVTIIILEVGEILRWVTIVGGTSQSLLQRRLIEPTVTDAAMLGISSSRSLTKSSSLSSSFKSMA